MTERSLIGKIEKGLSGYRKSQMICTVVDRVVYILENLEVKHHFQDTNRYYLFYVIFKLNYRNKKDEFLWLNVFP